MGLDYHSQVGVVVLWHVLLILAELDGDNAAEVRTRVVPGAGHEAEDQGLLRPRHTVRCPEHLLGFQHLLPAMKSNNDENVYCQEFK